jgi:hypothetical protein
MMKYHLTPTSAPHIALLGMVALLIGLSASEPIRTLVPSHSSRRVVRLAPPSAPGGLMAAAVSSSQISLSWTDTQTTRVGFQGGAGVLTERFVGANRDHRHERFP